MKHNLKTCLNKDTRCGQGSRSAFCHQGSCFLPGCVRKPPGSLYLVLGGTYFIPGHCICRNTLTIQCHCYFLGQRCCLGGLCVLSLFGRVWLFATPWTAARQAPLSMRFSKQEYWSGSPFPLQGIFPAQGSNPCLLHWQAVSSVLRHQGSRVVGCGWSSPGSLHGAGCVFHLDCTLLTEYFAELIWYKPHIVPLLAALDPECADSKNWTSLGPIPLSLPSCSFKQENVTHYQGILSNLLPWQEVIKAFKHIIGFGFLKTS